MMMFIVINKAALFVLLVSSSLLLDGCNGSKNSLRIRATKEEELLLLKKTTTIDNDNNDPSNNIKTRRLQAESSFDFFVKEGDGYCRDSSNNSYDSGYFTTGVNTPEECAERCFVVASGYITGLVGFNFRYPGIYVRNNCQCLYEDGTDLSLNLAGFNSIYTNRIGTGIPSNVASHSYFDCYKFIPTVYKTPRISKELTTDFENLDFTFDSSSFNNIIVDGVILQTFCRGDLGDSSELFEIKDEDGNVRGQNDGGTAAECSSEFNQVDFIIPISTFNNWTSDGQINVQAQPSEGSGSSGVHAYCSGPQGCDLQFCLLTLPSQAPTSVPSELPSTSQAPTSVPSELPSTSQAPTSVPSELPSTTPSQAPTSVPSELPSTSASPSQAPTFPVCHSPLISKELTTTGENLDFTFDSSSFNNKNVVGNYVTLQTFCRGNLDRADEFFEIKDEDGNVLGQNDGNGRQCHPGFHQVDFNIPISTYNNWTSDGQINIQAQASPEVDSYCLELFGRSEGCDLRFVYSCLSGPLICPAPAIAAEASSEAGTFVATNTIDKNPDTQWSSDNQSNGIEWISVDLGENQTIDTVVLVWGLLYGVEYILEVSHDNTDWTTVFTETSGNGGVDRISSFDQGYTTVIGRYVRMSGTRSNNTGYSLSEFSVFSISSEEQCAGLDCVPMSAIASSYLDNDTRFAAGNAIDQDMNTRWINNYREYPGFEWIELDFGKTKVFDNIQIIWEGGGWHASQYDIQISHDGGDNGNWETVFTVNNGNDIGIIDGNRKTDPVIDISGYFGRYLRVYCTDNYLIIYEIDVFSFEPSDGTVIDDNDSSSDSNSDSSDSSDSD